MKDMLFKKELFEFWVDDIYLYNDNTFSLNIIPNINSNYFPPYHLRTINVSTELLTNKFYNSYMNKYKDRTIQSNYDFIESVTQGSFYKISSRSLPNNLFSEGITIGKHNNIFQRDSIHKSPYLEETVIDSRNKPIFNIKTINDFSFNNVTDHDKYLYIYCLNVGQGDSLLIVFPNKHIYFIDINIYENTYRRYFNRIDKILLDHNLNKDRTISLIITHKHLDHLRGAKLLINKYKINNFLINHNYTHSTKPVYDLLFSAQTIPNWYNINNNFKYNEGSIEVSFNNPNSITCNNTTCPDINDSSIVITLKHNNNIIYLTGDAGHPIQNKFLKNDGKSHNLLKVSHHGSLTGTNMDLINFLKPKYSYISAGWSKRYNHPDKLVVDILEKHTKNFISKHIRNDILFISDGNKIVYKDTGDGP